MLEYAILCWSKGLILRVATIRAAKNVLVGTLHPVRWRCIDGSLYIAAIEIYLGAWREIITWIDYAEHVKKMRAGIQNMINVEARIDLQGGAENISKDIAALGAVLGWRKWAWRRKRKIFIYIICVATRRRPFMNCGGECLIQAEYPFPIVQIWYNRYYWRCQSRLHSP